MNVAGKFSKKSGTVSLQCYKCLYRFATCFAAGEPLHRRSLRNDLTGHVKCAG